MIKRTTIIFQSLGSVGPFLNFIALFPLMALLCGSDLPYATIVAFLIGFASFIPILLFSKDHRDGTGYASYTGESFGTKSQLFVGVSYLFYSALVIPNILMFSSFFLISFIYGANLTLEFLFSSALLLILFVLIKRGRMVVQSYISFLGIAEVMGLGIIFAFFILTGNSNLSYNSQTGLANSNFWESVLIGILMFSGSGSSIFLSKAWNGNGSEFRKSLMMAYVIVGVLMILSSLSVVRFLGSNTAAYGNNPDILLTIVSSHLTSYASAFIMILFMLSAFNLMLSYSNAFLLMFNNFERKFFSNPGKINSRNIFNSILILSLFSLSISLLTTGFYISFIILAEVVSMCYVIVHGISSLSMSISKTRSLKERMMAFVSLTLLVIALGASMENSSIGFDYTLTIFILIMVVSFVISNGIIKKRENQSPLTL